MPEFDGRSGIVTGAASGIGRASALTLAARGAYVAVADIDEDGGRQTVEMIRETGGSAEFVACDVSVDADVSRLVNALAASRGRLDFAHNNAGVIRGGVGFCDVTEADFRRIVEVNYVGTWRCMKYELQVMRAAGSGAIVNTGSITASSVPPLVSPYPSSKAAIAALTVEAAIEYAGCGIRVNAVLPGHINTPMAAMADDIRHEIEASIPMQRRGEPAELAAAAAWLLSDAASYVTGHCLEVDGGASKPLTGLRVGRPTTAATRARPTLGIPGNDGYGVRQES